MTKFTTIERTGRDTGKHFWRHDGHTLEHHRQGNPWRIVDDNVTDPATHIRLSGHRIISTEGTTN